MGGESVTGHSGRGRHGWLLLIYARLISGLDNRQGVAPMHKMRHANLPLPPKIVMRNYSVSLKRQAHVFCVLDRT